MRAIVFDTDLSSLVFEDDISILRLCYLIFDSICVGGIAGANFTFEREAKKRTVFEKVSYMFDVENRGDSDHKQTNLKNYNNYFFLTKAVKTVKNPPRGLLFAYNAAGKILSECFDDYVDNVVAIWKSKGYLDIVTLKKDDRIIETTLTEFTVGEWTQTLKSAPLNAKKVLGLLFSDTHLITSLLVLPKDFLLPQENETHINFPQIISTISFPDTASLTALQLISIREQLKESGHLFRENMDRWVLSFNDKTQDNDFKHLEESLKIFQNGINSNQMLIDNQNRIDLDAVTFTIKIGFTSLQNVWNYYRQCKILDDFTIEELINQTYHNSSYPQSIPFMCILPDYINKEKMDEINMVVEDGMLHQHKKKFLEF